MQEFLLGSEEDEAMVPSQEFCLKAHIPNTQKVPPDHLITAHQFSLQKPV